VHSPFRHVGSIFWKRRPIHLTFFVTRKCNAQCPYCFYLKSTDDKGSNTKDLSIDEIAKTSRSLGKLLWLAFSGGEIYLRKDLVELSLLFYKHNSPAIILYPTNGLLPELITEETEKIVRCCPKSVVVVKLSVDGLNHDHDVLRSTPGNFARVMETYHRLGKLVDRYPNFELGINTVFCAENQSKMGEIISFANALKKIKTHTISLIRGDLRQSHYKNVDYEIYRAVTDQMERNLKSRIATTYRFKGGRLKAAQDIIQRRLIHRTVSTQKRTTPCYAGKLSLVLTESGDLYPCETLTASSFGNVRDYNYDVNKLLRTTKAREIIRKIFNKQCHCTHECNFMMNILFNPRLYPSLVKEYLQLAGSKKPVSSRILSVKPSFFKNTAR
jgi:radical SAM protein with 4Fe4S-binding SPASM domain